MRKPSQFKLGQFNLGLATHLAPALADSYCMKRKRLCHQPVLVAVVVAAALFAAACGNSTELSTTDPGLTTQDRTSRESAGRGGGPEDARPASGDEGDVNAPESLGQAPITKTDADASPASRQSRQTSGASSVRTTDAADQATEPAPEPVQEPDSATAQTPTGQTPTAQTTNVVQQDVPIPQEAQRQQSRPQNRAELTDPSVAFENLDDRVKDVILAPETPCEPGVDAACTDVVEAQDGDGGGGFAAADPVDEQEVAAATAPSEIGEISDDPCPPGASYCSVGGEAGVAGPGSGGGVDAPLLEPSDDSAAIAAVDDDECGKRFWLPGCGGPEADPREAGAEARGPIQSETDLSDADTGDAGQEGGDQAGDQEAGVVVPQEVIDVLLTPADAVDARTPATKATASESSSDGGGHPDNATTANPAQDQSEN